MSRGLTHPTAHIGKPMIHKPTKQEYVYDGWHFYNDVEPHLKGINVIDRIKVKNRSGAIFKFKKSGKTYAIVYYGRSVTSSTKISGGDLNLEYSGRKGATENLKITSDKLIKYGSFEKRMLNGQEVECGVFYKASELQNSILRALKENPDVGPHVYDAVNDFFINKKTSFSWDGFRESDINELGKYLGELLIGVLVLDNRIPGHFSQNIFAGVPVTDFLVPNDPSFSGVDSAFTRKDSTLIPISSKLGSGAKASFFSNFLPKIIDKRNLPKSVIGDIAQAARDVNVTKQMLDKKGGAKQTVYEYGIRNILGLDKRTIPDSYKIFQDAKAKNITPELILVMAEVVKHPDIAQNVKDQLPASLTAAFTREMASRLNSDGPSKIIVEEVAAGKRFYQANLDLAKWKRGEIFFKLLLSGDSVVSFIGNKAAIGDINAEQGILNYALSYK